MSDFDKLAVEAEALLKAMTSPPSVDEDEDEDEEVEGDGKPPMDKGALKKSAAADEALAKSMKVTLADGTEREAFDGEALVKSLITQNQALHDANTGLQANQTKTMELLKSMAEQVGKLTAAVGALGDQGRGRKSATVAMPANPAKEPGAPNWADRATGEAFMAKALTAMGQNRLSPMDVAMAEASLNRGMAPPEQILRAVGAP